MHDKSILLAFSGIVIVAFLVLSFVIEKRALDPDAGKDWWSVAFVSPTDQSLDFIVENHSATTAFSYSLTHGKEIDATKTIDIPRGSSATIPVSLQAAPDSARTTVTVWTGEKDKKEIYK